MFAVLASLLLYCHVTSVVAQFHLSSALFNDLVIDERTSSIIENN